MENQLTATSIETREGSGLNQGGVLPPSDKSRQAKLFNEHIYFYVIFQRFFKKTAKNPDPLWLEQLNREWVELGTASSTQAFILFSLKHPTV